MRKWWHFLWILWGLLGVVNLLFINVYINHAGVTEGGVQTLSLYQQLGYFGLTAAMFLLCGLWWIFTGNSKGQKGLTVLGVLVTVFWGLVIVGGVVYGLVAEAKFGFMGTATAKLAEWFSFLKF